MDYDIGSANIVVVLEFPGQRPILICKYTVVCARGLVLRSMRLIVPPFFEGHWQAIDSKIRACKVSTSESN